MDAYEPVVGNEERVLNKKAVSLACQHFLGRSTEDIKASLLSTMEGHQVRPGAAVQLLAG